MNQAEKFARLNPEHVQWHERKHTFRYYTCTCGFDVSSTEYHLPEKVLDRHIKSSNPTFSTVESILEVMMKRNDNRDFLDHIGISRYPITTSIISIEYIIVKGKLLTEAINWCEQHQKEG